MRSIQYPGFLAHVSAGGLALGYAWFVSGTALSTTGLQFIAPLLIILFVHFVWMAVAGALQPGFSQRLYGKSCRTAVSIVLILVLASVFAPKPAHADTGEVLGVILMVVVCAAMIAVVVGLAALALYVIGRIFIGLLSLIGRGGRGKGTFFDFGSLAVSSLFLVVASLEGVPHGFAFSAEGRASADYFIDTPPERVWQVMQTATSPAVPLPAILSVFPQPVDVSTDEGTVLGANRVVQFEGREGAGALHLIVAERSDTVARFEVVSDTTPYAGWINYRALTYTVIAEGSGARLSVALDYDRQLAPAWFFDPVMHGAGYLAVDVLARDVADRAAR